MSLVDPHTASAKPRARWLRVIVAAFGLLRPRRRWLQFSLRTLFIATALFALWLGFKVHRVRQQKAAVAALEASDSGNSVCYDYQFDRSGKMIPNASPPGPAWFRRLVGEDYFRSVRWVRLGQPTDEDLAQLGHFPRLQELIFRGPFVTEEGLSHLQGLSRLKELAVENLGMTDAGMAFLSGLHDLEGLSLYECRVSDVGLVHLEHLENLTALRLVRTQVTAEGVNRLSQALPNLKVSGSGFPSAPQEKSAVAQLTRVGALFQSFEISGRVVEVTLQGAAVTDASLAPLRQLRDLRRLVLNSTHVTADGIAELKAALPPGLDVFPPFVPSAPQEQEAIARLMRPGVELQAGNEGTIQAAALCGRHVTDATLADLRAFGSLKNLTISTSNVTDAGLVHLEGLGNLESLALLGATVTDAGLAHVRGLRRLKQLTLLGVRETGPGLAHLENLPNLKRLTLCNTGVSDEALVHLEPLTSLIRLQLSETTITDAGLLHLHALKRLQYLKLAGSTQITPGGIAKLQQALPETQIVR
jgi:internalin A